MSEKRRLKSTFTKSVRRRVAAGLLAAAALSGCSSAPPRSDAQTPFPVMANASMTLTRDTEAIFRRSSPKPADIGMNEREKILAYFGQLCLSPDDQPRAGQENLRAAFERLSALPQTGRALVNMAVRDNIRLCDTEVLPAGVGAQYEPALDSVLIPGTIGPEGLLLRLAHELLHAGQNRNGLLNYNHDWDIQSRLSRNLSIEAAAIALEVLVAFEMRQQGDPSAWDYLRAHGPQSAYGDPRLYTLADETWAAAKQAGKADEAAMRDVGRALWQRMFENRNWLDMYLNVELSIYLSDIVSGKMDGQQGIRPDADAQRKVDTAGVFGGGESFTRGGRVPPLERLLAGNDRMRHAYRAVDLERHRRSLGAGHPQTIALRAQAEVEGNPYLALDMAAVFRQMRQGAFPVAGAQRKFLYLYEYMDAALPAPPQQDNAPERKPPIPASVFAQAQTPDASLPARLPRAG